MSRPEISVIVPTFGRQEQMRTAVRTALAQDADLEVVVVDDGSPQPITLDDDSGRVRLVRSSVNLGAAGARNIGADQAQGEWIAFLDSDDVWPEGSLRPRLEAAQEAPDPTTTIWAGAFVDVWPEERRGLRRVPKASASPLDFASGCWMCPGSTALMSRAAWARSGGQDASLRRLEDYEWLLRWGLAGGRLAVHSGVAAEITRGGRAAPDLIDAASRVIRSKFSSAPAPIVRRIESYLSLERGAALLHRRDRTRGLMALGKSWVLHPRLQPALENFWSRS